MTVAGCMLDCWGNVPRALYFSFLV